MALNIQPSNFDITRAVAQSNEQREKNTNTMLGYLDKIKNQYGEYETNKALRKNYNPETNQIDYNGVQRDLMEVNPTLARNAYKSLLGDELAIKEKNLNLEGKELSNKGASINNERGSILIDDDKQNLRAKELQNFSNHINQLASNPPQNQDQYNRLRAVITENFPSYAKMMPEQFSPEVASNIQSMAIGLKQKIDYQADAQKNQIAATNANANMMNAQTSQIKAAGDNWDRTNLNANQQVQASQKDRGLNIDQQNANTNAKKAEIEQQKFNREKNNGKVINTFQDETGNYVVREFPNGTVVNEKVNSDYFNQSQLKLKENWKNNLKEIDKTVNTFETVNNKLNRLTSKENEDNLKTIYGKPKLLSDFNVSLDTMKNLLLEKDTSKFKDGVKKLTAADTSGMLENLGVQQFLINIETLKGTGALSDSEGARLSSVIANFLNTNQSPDQARKLMIEFKNFNDQKLSELKAQKENILKNQNDMEKGVYGKIGNTQNVQNTPQIDQNKKSLWDSSF